MNQATRRRLAEGRARRHLNLGRAATPAFQRVVRTEQRAVLKGWKTGGQKGALSAVDPTRWEKVLRTIWFGVAIDDSWQATIDSLTPAPAKAVSSLPDRVLRRLDDFVKGRARLITNRTIRDLQSLFLEFPDFADEVTGLIANLYDRYYLDRAARIAIQEVLSATAEAQHQAATTVGEGPIDHTWTTVGDSHVRASHAAADGQTVPLDVPFIVGGASLNYPRDPGGPMEEVAGCRCSEFYTRRTDGR